MSKTPSGAGGQAAAEALAAEALAWMAGQGERMQDFLVASGAGPAEIRARIGDPDFLAAVLDFVLLDDTSVLDFAAHRGVTPEAVLRARASLPGGDLPHFT